MNNPYPEYIFDEVAGIQVKNNDYTIWQEGYEAAKKEVVDWANEYLGVLGYPPWEAKLKEWEIKLPPGTPGPRD